MGEAQSDLYSDIYKIILANYYELDDFILYNYPDVSRWGYSQQGVDVAVVPNRYKWHGISGSYALGIKEIREDLLRKSVYYRGSFRSFQKEFEPLLTLYKEIQNDINKSCGKLNTPLLELIKKFLFALDAEFLTNNYFFNRVLQFYVSRTLALYDLDQKPIKGLEISIFSLDNSKPISLRTSQKGLVICDLKSGKYLVKLEKLNVEKPLEVTDFDCSYQLVINIKRSGFFRKYKPVI